MQGHTGGRLVRKLDSYHLASVLRRRQTVNAPQKSLQRARSSTAFAVNTDPQNDLIELSVLSKEFSDFTSTNMSDENKFTGPIQ